MKTIDNVTALYKRHVKMVYRLCYSFMGNAADAEDATQATFMKLVNNPRTFADAEHEKAWLITCASNVCRDELKSARRTRTTDLTDEIADTRVDESVQLEPSDALAAVLALPDRYKDCIYLHYYEGYKTAEIAEMLGRPPSTIRNDLSEARKLLRAQLESEGATDER